MQFSLTLTWQGKAVGLGLIWHSAGILRTLYWEVPRTTGGGLSLSANHADWRQHARTDSSVSIRLKQVGLNLELVCGSENHLFVRLHEIRWAAYTERAAVQDVGIDHGGAHILVAQQLLDGSDVLAPLQ